MNTNRIRTSTSTKTLVFAAVMTAVVVVLQVMAILTRAVLPAFAINLVLVPIVIGAAIGGVKIGAWLGLVSGIAVLVSGDAAAFLTVNIGGTIATVLLKGLASGIAAAFVYKLLESKNKYLAVLAAAVACPLANTGVFILGSFIFFIDTIREWGSAMGFENAFAYILIGMVGINFIIELVLNIILSPTIVRLLDLQKKH